jgi:DNA-binding CsgD family transcriptional regulator
MDERRTRVQAVRERDSGDAWVAQGHRLSRPQAAEVIELLLAARRDVDPALLPHPEHVVDYPSARAVLRDIWTAAVASMAAAPTGEMITLLQQVKDLDERVLISQVRYRDQAFQRVRDALAGLAEARTTAALIDLAPVAACSLGFDRSIVSRVEDSLWIPERVHVEKDARWAEEILAIGRAAPQVLGGTLVETEMVRRRVPILVDGVQDRAGVHKAIADASMSRSYAAAPILVGGDVEGFVHVDCYFQQRNLDETDRQVLATYADGLGQALARTAVLDRLEELRADVDALGGRLARARAGGGVRWGGAAPDGPAGCGGPERDRFLSAAPVDPNLTRREAEVLRLMAAGDTNARIARRLVISEGTVKSHVKHILRKLGAANRAEAVSHWLRKGHAAAARSSA